jgi:hypothetical protein
MKQPSGFYADSLEMLLDTMCNVLGGVIFITLALAALEQNSPSESTAVHQDKMALASNQVAAVTSSNAVMEAELAQTLQRIQNPTAQTNQMRLPNTSHTSKQPWTIVMRYGKAYSVYVFGSGENGRPALNTQSIAWQSGALEPAADAGDDPEQAVESLAENFRTHFKTNYYFDFKVYEDSFPAFVRARETADRLGFQFGWEPLPENQRLKLSRQGERSLPQN